MAADIFAKYWLAQLPGWGISAGVLAGAYALFDLPLWVALALFAVLVVKDVIFYPFARRTLESPPHMGPATLVGASGTVVQRLAPEGTVRIGGELWRAETRAAALEPGARVRVEALRGLTLLVRPEDG